MCIFFVALLSLPALAHGWSHTQDEPGIPSHWAVDTVTLALDSAHPSKLKAADVERALDGALHAWSALPESRVMLALGVPRRGAEDASERPFFNLVRFCQDDWRWDPNMLASTVLWVRAGSGEIVGATIEVNEEKYEFSTDGKEGYDLQAVLTHEIGHMLGLGHSEVDDASMYARTRQRDLKQRTPKEDDRRGIAALYPEGLPLTSISALPPAAGCSAAPGGAPARGLLAVCLLVVAALWRRRDGRPQAQGPRRRG